MNYIVCFCVNLRFSLQACTTKTRLFLWYHVPWQGPFPSVPASQWVQRMENEAKVYRDTVSRKRNSALYLLRLLCFLCAGTTLVAIRSSRLRKTCLGYMKCVSFLTSWPVFLKTLIM